MRPPRAYTQTHKSLKHISRCHHCHNKPLIIGVIATVAMFYRNVGIYARCLLGNVVHLIVEKRLKMPVLSIAKQDTISHEKGLQVGSEIDTFLLSSSVSLSRGS